MSKEYLICICDECAKQYSGELFSGYWFSYFQDICTICNEWKPLTFSNNFKFPKNQEFTIKYDRIKIYHQLRKILDSCMESHQFEEASILCHRIDDLIHDILENGVDWNGTVDALAGKS